VLPRERPTVLKAVRRAVRIEGRGVCPKRPAERSPARSRYLGVRLVRMLGREGRGGKGGENYLWPSRSKREAPCPWDMINGKGEVCSKVLSQTFESVR
jgi:hypothetical protein